MPKLKRTTPCSECPFRRDSIPGYLGAEKNPQAFVRRALLDYDDGLDLPCHLDIDYEDADWQRSQYPEAAYCAGALIMAANNCKLPRESKRAAAVNAVKPSAAVFTSPAEFEDYHKK